MNTGQLAASIGLVEVAKNNQHPITLVLYNTDTVSETVTVSLTPTGGSASTIYQAALGSGESVVISGIPLGPGDTVSGSATNASKVNYFTLPCPVTTPFAIQTFSNNGSLKQVNSVSTVAGAFTGTSASANALAVGPSGTTNPSFNVDASTASAATGLNVKSAAAASGLAVSVISSGTNESMTIDAKGSGSITLNGVAAAATGVVIGSATAAAGTVLNVISSSANAFTVGQNGSTNPALKVNANTASSATGLSITSAASGGGLAIAVISSAGAENLTENAKGTGTITIGGISTGLVSIGRGSTNVVIESSTKTTLSSGTAVTGTAAQLLGGYIVISGQTAATTFTTDIGANIDGAIAGVATGDCFFVTLYNANTSSGAVTITAGASGITLKGNATLPISKSAVLFFERTGASAWDVVSMISG